jgi:hypothetical protein
MHASLLRPALWRLFLTALLLCLLGQTAQAQLLCVYDPLGAGGDYYSMFKDYQLAAKRWGVSIDLKVYTDDGLLDAAFKSGQCDMASMIGMRARFYNQFTGTIDAPGVIENWAQLRDVMNLVASPKLAKAMVSGNYEVDGVVPIGPTYVLTSDRWINSFERANGKKVAVMGWDSTQSMMAEDFKVTPVPTDLPHYAGLFNNGKVDIIVVPMALYKALELGKGIGSKGGIVRRPLFQFTMQLVAHTDKFPPDYGQKSREYMNTQTDHALSLARNLEAEVDSRIWIYAVRSEITEWNVTMRAALEHMTKAGNFDRRMLSLMKRVRCKTALEEPECAPTAEQAKNAGRPDAKP